jgi:predicted phosphodiesterase
MSFIDYRLSSVYKKSKRIECDNSSKIVIMSDCHRGDHSLADNFSHNKIIYEHALEYYNEREFIYIENGDGDELWENKSFKNDIWVNYNDIFDLLYDFHKANRLYMIYGNHDMVKKYKRFNHSFLNCIASNRTSVPLSQVDLDNYKTYQSITLMYKDEISSKRIPIFVVHGHQGDIPNDILWYITKRLVRFIWRRLELIGIKDPTSPANSTRKCTRLDRKIKKWSRINNQIVIAGHTHFPQYPELGQAPYFNDGSCVHPESITAIEIEKGYIMLVKWQVETTKKGTIFVERSVWKGPIKISEFTAKH